MNARFRGLFCHDTVTEFRAYTKLTVQLQMIVLPKVCVWGGWVGGGGLCENCMRTVIMGRGNVGLNVHR